MPVYELASKSGCIYSDIPLVRIRCGGGSVHVKVTCKSITRNANNCAKSKADVLARPCARGYEKQ